MRPLDPREPPRRCRGPAWVFVLLALLPRIAAGAPLVLSSANDPPNATDDHTGICDRVVAEAFRRVGVPVTLQRLPSERALIRANEGTDDGNFARVEGIERQYPNLVRVPEEITRFAFVAFATRPDVKVNDWASLTPHRVGIITGWKILEANAAGARSLTKVSDEDGLFRLLGAGRVDLVLYDRAQGHFYLGRHGVTGVRVLEPPLAERPMYLYLNRGHEALVPRLAQALADMRRDGTLERLRREALRGLGERGGE